MQWTNRKLAIISGVSLILMALAAGYAYGYVQSSLVVLDDAQATAANLRNNSTLFASGVFGWLIILITDILVAWCLYKFFKSVHPKMSLITGLIRGIYSVVLAVAIYQLTGVCTSIKDPTVSAENIMQFMEHFEQYWSFGLIIFGLHLVGLGYLALKSGFIPKWMGGLLYVAGISYTLIHGAKALVSRQQETIALAEMILGVPMAIAELGLAVWLIWSGGKTK
jgi:VanZ family protein